MPTFDLELMDATGIEVRETVDADTQEEAIAVVKCHGLFVTRCTQRSEPKPADESEPEDHRYPGYGQCVGRWFNCILRDGFWFAIIGFCAACVLWVLAKVFTFDPPFWATQRWTIGIIVGLVLLWDTFKELVLMPWGFWVYAQTWEVSFSESQAACLGGILTSTGHANVNDMTAEEVRHYIWSKRVAEDAADAAGKMASAITRRWK